MKRSSTRGYGFPQSGFQRLLPLLVGAGLLAVHIHVTRQGDQYTGLLLIVDHLFDVAIVLLILLGCTAVGRYALTNVGAQFDRPTETLLFSVAIGAGLLSTLILILGAAVGIHGSVLWLLIIGVILASRGEIRELRLTFHAGRDVLRRGQTPWTLFGLGVFAVVAGFLLLHAVAPPTDWDTLMYHIKVPSDFLSAGRIYVPEDNLHVSRTSLFHFLYLPLLATQSISAPALLSAAMALLLAVALFAFCARFLAQETAAASLASLWGTTTILLVAVTPRVDVTLAFFLFLAHYALLLALINSARQSHFLVAALLLGFAFGIKFQAITYMLSLVPLVFWTARSLNPTSSGTLRNCLQFGLLVSLAASPWLLKNWLLLGAPTYPLLSPRILPPWLIPLFGSHYVPASIDPDIFDWVWDLRKAFNLRDAFLNPGLLTIEVEGRLYFTNPILLALPLSVAFIRNRAMRWLLIPAVLSLVFLLVPFPHSNPRYLVPSLVPLTIVALHTIFLASSYMLGRNKSFLILIPTVTATLIPTAFSVYFWTREVDAAGYFIGITSRKQFLEDHMFLKEHMELVGLLSSELPSESRVLLLFEARGYYFERDVLQDNMSRNWALLSPRLNDDDCLEETDITHVVLNNGALAYFSDGGLDVHLIQWRRWQGFSARCLTLINQVPSRHLPGAPIRVDHVYSIYRVKSDPNSSSHISLDETFRNQAVQDQPRVVFGRMNDRVYP